MKTILFVCTGNTCRSSMAETLMRKMLMEAGEKTRGIKVISAGTSAVKGQKASKNAVQVMQEKQLDMTGHQARPLTPELIREADLVLTMTRNHKEQVLAMAPDAKDKVFTLKEYGGRLGNYEQIVGEIDKLQSIIHRKKSDFIKSYEKEIKSLRDQRYQLMTKLQEVDDRIKELERKMAKTVVNDHREMIYLQDKLSSVDISDPFGQPMGIYRECAKEIEEELKIVLNKILESLK